jgi:hypothetical protein
MSEKSGVETLEYIRVPAYNIPVPVFNSKLKNVKKVKPSKPR